MTHSPDATARLVVASHLERAEFYQEVGRWEDFEEALRAARREDPVGPTALLRAVWLARRGRVDDAVVELEGVLALGSVNCEPIRFVDAGRLLAVILQEANRHHEADRALQRAVAVAVEHDLFDAPLVTALAVSSIQRGEPGAAERLLRAATRLADDTRTLAAALSRLGELYVDEGRNREAVPCLWRAYRAHATVGDDRAAGCDLVNLGDLCWSERRTRLAFRAWRRAIVRFERCGDADGAEHVWRRLDEAPRIIAVWNRDPELN